MQKRLDAHEAAGHQPDAENSCDNGLHAFIIG
jgi:hypothetical protein